MSVSADLASAVHAISLELVAIDFFFFEPHREEIVENLTTGLQVINGEVVCGTVLNIWLTASLGEPDDIFHSYNHKCTDVVGNTCKDTLCNVAEVEGYKCF